MNIPAETLAGPEWAHGCPACKFGIVLAPELTSVVELYLERVVQMTAGDIVFCDCQAGSRYRASLLNRRQQLIEEARRDPRLTAHALRNSHPDLDAATRMVQDATRPSIHFEKEAV